MNKTTSDTTPHPLPSRRSVLGAGGAVGLALLNPTSIFAQGADGANTIRVGFISPRTGALAGFGEADGYVLELARKSLKDGLTVGGKKYAVEILDRDSQSSPNKSAELAGNLILNDEVNLLVPASTTEWLPSSTATVESITLLATAPDPARALAPTQRAPALAFAIGAALLMASIFLGREVVLSVRSFDAELDTELARRRR